MAKKKAASSPQAFKLTLHVNNTEYKTEGDTFVECLDKIPLEFTQIKSKGNFVIEKTGSFHERPFNALQLRRLLNKKTVFRKFLGMQIADFFKLKFNK